MAGYKLVPGVGIHPSFCCGAVSSPGPALWHGLFFFSAHSKSKNHRPWGMCFVTHTPWDPWRNWTLLVGEHVEILNRRSPFRMPEIVLPKQKTPPAICLKALIISEQKVGNFQEWKVQIFSCFLLFISFLLLFCPRIVFQKRTYGHWICLNLWISTSSSFAAIKIHQWTIHDSWLALPKMWDPLEICGENDDPTLWRGALRWQSLSDDLGLRQDPEYLW